MSNRTRVKRRRGRTIYCCFHFTEQQLQEIVSMCGLLRLDVDLTPTRDELRDALRNLVTEALASRRRRAGKKHLARRRRVGKLPSESPHKETEE